MESQLPKAKKMIADRNNILTFCLNIQTYKAKRMIHI